MCFHILSECLVQFHIIIIFNIFRRYCLQSPFRLQLTPLNTYLHFNSKELTSFPPSVCLNDLSALQMFTICLCKLFRDFLIERQLAVGGYEECSGSLGSAAGPPAGGDPRSCWNGCMCSGKSANRQKEAPEKHAKLHLHAASPLKH